MSAIVVESPRGLRVDREAESNEPWSSNHELRQQADAAKPGGGSWSNFSDARLKRDIEPIAPGMLDRLLTLHGYRFEYIEDAIQNRFGLPGRQTGLIAQEVQSVFPDWVASDDEGYLYVTERGLTEIFVEAMRELRYEKNRQRAEDADRIALLESLNAEHERRIRELAERLTRLETQATERGRSTLRDDH